jgi:hypothetical protein
MLYNGTNNGELYLSVRDAATSLNTGSHQASAAFRELEQRGFIRPRQRGAFAWKARHATAWLLTEYDDDISGHAATKEFMLWRRESEPKNKTRLPERQQTDAGAATDGRTAALSDAGAATASPASGAQSDAGAATQIVYQGDGAAGTSAPHPDHDPTPDDADAPPHGPPAHPDPARVLTKNGGSAKNGPDLSGYPKGKGFGPWLGAQRNALRVQVAELAKAIGIGASDLYAIETGQRELGIGLKRKAVEYLRERAS